MIEAQTDAHGLTRQDKNRGLLGTYWQRFRRHHMALVGTVILFLLLLMAIFGPLFIPLPEVDTTQVTIGNRITTRMDADKHVAPCFLSFFGGSSTHNATIVGAQTQPPRPCPEYIMGTDVLGKDVWASIVNGSRTSLLVGFVATLIACILGTIAGTVSGYFGGWVDSLIMRVADIFLAVPLLLFLILMTRFLVKPIDPKLGITDTSDVRGSPALIIALAAIIGFLESPSVARLVRSVTLSVREQDFVLAARAVGQKPGQIILRHIVPNVLNPVIVAGTLFVGSNIVLEAFLSFLGFGVQPPNTSWGTILSNAQSFLALGNWWWALFPGTFILLTVLAINFIGDGLRDALDPRTLLS